MSQTAFNPPKISQSVIDLNDQQENHKLKQILSLLNKVFEKPALNIFNQSTCDTSKQSNKQQTDEKINFFQVQLQYSQDQNNQSVITNPSAILDVLNPDIILKNDFNESNLCVIFDQILNILNICTPNNSCSITDLLNQKNQILRINERNLQKILNLNDVNQSDLLRQFLHQLDQSQLKVQFEQMKQLERVQIQNLLRRFGLKVQQFQNSYGLIGQSPAQIELNLESVQIDILINLIYLGCKLSSQIMPEATLKICKISYLLSEGTKFQRYHLEFLIQFVIQKYQKIKLLQTEENNLISKVYNGQKNNKIELIHQLIIEKQKKFQFILKFVLDMLDSLTCNFQKTKVQKLQNQLLLGVSKGENLQNNSERQNNYFFFNGNQSGLEYDVKSTNQINPQTVWPFQQEYTCAIQFKITKISTENQSLQSRNNTFQVNQSKQFNSKSQLSLPILFNCFSEGYGGFECYINTDLQVIYRILPKTYSPPSSDSNGVKIADLEYDKWNVLVIEHEKPFLARAQLISVINDKQQVNFPIDYPKFDQSSKITKMNVFKGITGQLGYLIFFKNHFSHVKKFVGQLLKLGNIDELILLNDKKIDNFFNDLSSQNQQQQLIQESLIENIVMLYSPTRCNQNQAFQSKVCQEKQYSHQVQIDLNLTMLINTGVHNRKIDFNFDLNQMIPLLQIILMQEGKTNELINSWFKIVSKMQIEDYQFIESFFFLLQESQKFNSQNVKNYQMVDVETLELIREIKYKIFDFDEKKENGELKIQQLGKIFFKSLIQSTDFWINQSMITENHLSLNQQYWQLIKTFYVERSSENFQQIFPIQNLIILMSEISKANSFTNTDSQNIASCCSFHSKTSKLLVHNALKKDPTQPNCDKLEEEAFQIYNLGNNKFEDPKDEIQNYKTSEQKQTNNQAKQENNSESIFFKKENFSQEIKNIGVQQIFEPITAVLESVLNFSNRSPLNQVYQNFHSYQQKAQIIPEDSLCIIDCIGQSLTKSEMCPCFQINMLKLLKLVFVDQKDHEMSQIFAQRFINEQGIQILLYLCSVARTFDVKAYCVKIIDVLCTNHTNLIKTIRIDTDLIPYLCEVLIPKDRDYDIDRIKKKRLIKLQLKKQEKEAIQSQKQLKQNVFGTKGREIQIVTYQEDQYQDQVNFQDNQEMTIEKQTSSDKIKDQVQLLTLNNTLQFKQLKQNLILDNFDKDNDNQQEDKLSKRSADYAINKEKKKAYQQSDNLDDIDTNIDQQNNYFMIDSLDEKKLNKLFEEGIEESEGFLMQDLNTFNKLFVNQNESEKIQESQEYFYQNQQQNQQFMQQYQIEQKSIMIPAAPQGPKGKTKPKFAFDNLASESEEEVQNEPEFDQNNDQKIKQKTAEEKQIQFTQSDKQKYQNQISSGHSNMMMNKMTIGNSNNQNLDQEQDWKLQNENINRDFQSQMMQSQRLPNLKQSGFQESDQNFNQCDDFNQQNQIQKQNKSKFANENTMAKSNLREKQKTFNFGQFGDENDSEDGKNSNEDMHPDFYNQNEIEKQTNSDEEFEIQLRINKKEGTRKNPFASRIGKQEIQASHLRKNKLNKQKNQIGKLQTTNQDKKQETDVAKKQDISINDEETAQVIKLINQSTVCDSTSPVLGLSSETPNLQSYSQQNDKIKINNKKLKQPQKLQFKMTISNNFSQSLAIDTDAINELYTYGGEQGQKKSEQLNEIQDFEQDILELANQCLAAMDRKNPNDPIVYSNNFKGKQKKFDQVFLQKTEAPQNQEPNSATYSDQIENQEEQQQKQNFFRPNFNVPQTMKGIKNLALGFGQKKGE